MTDNTITRTNASLFSFSIKETVLCGMFAALIAVISQFSVPMPTGVPITIQLFSVVLAGSVLGSRLGFISALVYVLIGAIGLPVYANFRGGFHELIGVTGGYLWAYPVFAALCGIYPKTRSKKANLFLRILFATLGMIILETVGGLYWASLAGDKTVGAIFTYSMITFVPKDFVLTMAGIFIGGQIHRTLIKANALN